MMFNFGCSTIINGADCTVQPPNSTAIISCPFGIISFQLKHAKFLAASSGVIYLNLADLSFVCNLRAPFSYKNDIRLPESAIANTFSAFVFSLNSLFQIGRIFCFKSFGDCQKLHYSKNCLEGCLSNRFLK